MHMGFHRGPPGRRGWGADPDEERVPVWPYLVRMWRDFGRAYWQLALGIAVALMLGAYLGTYAIQIIKDGVNEAVEARGGDLSRFLLLGVVFLLLSVGGSLLGLLSRLWTNRLQTELSYDLRGRVYDHIQRLSLQYFESVATGDLMSRAVGDANAVAERLMMPLIRIGSLVSRFGFTLYFVMQMNWQLALLSMAGVPLALAVMYHVGLKVRDAWRRFRESDAEVWTMLSENIAGITEIKAFGREGHESARFDDKSTELKSSARRSRDLGATMGFFVQTLFMIGTAIVLFKGGLDVYRGVMDTGELTAFFVYLGMLISPIVEVGFMYSDLQRSGVSAKRVFDVLDTKSTVVEAPDARELGPVEATIRFEDVHFTYEDGRDDVLHGIDLTIAPGQTIALVGPSGGGKTTIAKLVPRFYDPSDGAVRVGGVDVREATLDSLRERIAVVFQEPFLFNGTIGENILFGRPGATEEEMLEAARAAHVDEFVQEFEDGYDTVIGERGIKLSGGQRQRVAIARALLKDTDILILDEATSNVDTHTERAIQRGLRRLMEGRTCLVIAHRLSTILHADKIVLISGGRMVEEGPHEELIEKEDGEYRALYEAQYDVATGMLLDEHERDGPEQRPLPLGTEDELEMESPEAGIKADDDSGLASLT